ncbi:MAG TPA: hypothetical protein VKK79_10860 [Candidatus Lokiarchaeia archaeon]|nr:hypothetical protein [Candidatus Lokiarchaeia archaeon]
MPSNTSSSHLIRYARYGSIADNLQHALDAASERESTTGALFEAIRRLINQLRALQLMMLV